ncbi:MAG: PilZ domain-containing protein [Ghiorsea sp.]
MPDSNRRQDFRIDDVLPMSDELLTKEEFDTQKLQLGIRSRQNSMLQEMVGKDIFSTGAKGALHNDVANAMEMLDAKLNYLIGVNMLNDANRSDLKERPVNFSVTGMSFYTDAKYQEGDYIKTTIMLPSFPPTILELIGTIAWARKERIEAPMHVAIRFNYRCDEEENSIAKYVFRRHRESLRLRAKEKDEGQQRIDSELG